MKPTKPKIPIMPPTLANIKLAAPKLGKAYWRRVKTELTALIAVKQAPMPPKVLLDATVNFHAPAAIMLGLRDKFFANYIKGL